MRIQKYKIFTAVFAAIILLITACSPQKRFNRLIAKHPGLVDTVTYVNRDTILEKDTVIIPEYRDSFTIDRDTVIVTERVVITKQGTSFGLQIKSDTLILRDTIYYSKPVKGKVIYQQQPLNTWMGVIIVILIMMMMAMFLK